MPRITLEDKPALGEVTGAGHLYLVLRDDSETDDEGLIIRGGQDGTLTGTLGIEADVVLGNSEDAYDLPDTESTRHARDITAEVGLGSWSAMVAYAQGIDGVYDYELPLASGDRYHVANSNAVIFSVLNLVGVDARTLDARPTPWPRMAEKRAFGD